MPCSACFGPCASWLWSHISPAVGSWLGNSVEEALSWGWNWVAENVLGYGAPRPVLLQPNSPYPLVGAKGTLSKILSMLEENEAKVVGIWGPAGVGKTALLKKLNDDLSRTRSGGFDVVIFVTVSKDVHIDRIQEKIGERLVFKSPYTSDVATNLCNALAQKKFLLLLDDLWEKLDLSKVGIPFPPNSKEGSKVVFTTRFKNVCADMDAFRWKVKVPYLSTESSWELFCQKVGKREEEWTDSRISLAQQVADKCGGLPLALITVGRAMATATADGEWRQALRKLEGMTAKLGGMEEVLTLLKFSFDKIQDECHKECLLYCALYPEDYDIEVDELIEYWVGEGFFEGEGYGLSLLKDARDCGLEAITALKNACLLEDSENNAEYVKLHDVVREMLLWITRCLRQETVFTGINGQKLSVMPQIWKGDTRILVKNRVLLELHEMPKDENLRALVLKHIYSLGSIHERFFSLMPVLKVLDLSSIRIKHLPPEIGSLVELRYLNLSYSSLVSLPKEVGELTELRYLNLSCSHLASLPKEVGKLTKLRILNMACNVMLRDIPKEALLSLSCLQSLNFFHSGIHVPIQWIDNDLVCLKDLKSLKELEEMGLALKVICQEDLGGQQDFHRLWAAMRYLELSDLGSFSFDMSDILRATKDLKELVIKQCPRLKQLIFPTDKRIELEKLYLTQIPLATFSFKDSNTLVTEPIEVVTFQNLRVLCISNCNALLEITWIRELPQLEVLDVKDCLKMVEIIAIEESTVTGMDSFFPRLRQMRLSQMRSLKSICRQPLLFPSLQVLSVEDCVELKKLPFRHESAMNIQMISCSSEWKDHLEWDHEEVRLIFTSNFFCFEEEEEEDEEGEEEEEEEDEDEDEEEEQEED